MAEAQYLRRAAATYPLRREQGSFYPPEPALGSGEAPNPNIKEAQFRKN